MTRRPVPEHLPQFRYPADPWKFVEVGFSNEELHLTETLFAVGNGYLGLRGDHEEGRDSNDPGTFINGFHETWSIHHAEQAFGFATTGQTIVNVPDPKIMSLYVDDEPLELSAADLASYGRELDLRRGTLSRDLTWRTAAGKLVRVRSQRLVSLVHRHIAAITFEVTMEQGAAPVVVASRLLNRQDAEYEARPEAFTESVGVANPERDPRRHRTFNHRVLQPRIHTADDRQMVLGFQCTNSKMSIACAARHQIESTGIFDVDIEISPDEATAIVASTLSSGQSLKVTKFVSYHTSRYAPHLDAEIVDDAFELATRCARSLDRVEHDGYEALVSAQEAWLDEFWASSDVEVRHRRGRDTADVSVDEIAEQQALRWNLFQLAQASAQVGEQGIAAKGVTGGGYEGHYFWDTEMYVAPFLSYTRPEAARQLMRFRWRMLPIARNRALALNSPGALYPWRTINGEEASAYYAAGTAQYHIDAAIAFALKRYVDASGDIAFLATDGAEILVETARMWNDLGFYSTRRNGNGTFHIHGVTGPDEYTTVVNDNLYTNVMARFNLRYAARVLELLEDSAPDAYAAIARRVDLGDHEAPAWVRAAESMYLPYDHQLGIHPQDADFLDLQPWDFDATPSDKYPLLLHFHPLVIYRHQVLKQADVVLAMSLRNDQFSPDVRKRNFDYYDPITTGDSSLSACVQAAAAAQIGYGDLAVHYFREALFVDLADLHGNARDGVHVASCGGVWGTVAFGFAGMYETGTSMSFDPKLPERYERITFRAQHHGSRMHIELDADGCTVSVTAGDTVPIHTTAGWTGLTLEPAGEEAAGMSEETAPPEGPDDDSIDRVVPIEVGQSIRISCAASATAAPAAR